ncbi:MAG: GntR family transcriptional regulator, partial [Bacteroidia bacterium]
ADIGAYLDGGDTAHGGWGDILLPKRYLDDRAEVGQYLTVFIYFDSEDRIIATTERPYATVGQFAYLRVTDVNRAGAFVDWGLPKEVLIPYAEQAKPLRKGAFHVVYLFQDDESERVTGSTKLSKFLDNTEHLYQKGQTCDGLVMAKTELGYKVIIDHQYTGLLYDSEVFTPLKIGQTLAVIVNKIRDDGKIDLRLPRPDKSDLSELEQSLLTRLAANHGVLHLGDKTPPEAIYQTLGVSKKNFKRAISRLYKKRLIVVESDKITQVKPH